MIYEMRVYRCVPGKLPALLNRFANITLKIWERHGIKQAGFFTTLVGESNQELTYFLAWESLADREKKWNAFQADPEWHRQARRDREGRRDRRQRLESRCCRRRPSRRSSNRMDRALSSALNAHACACGMRAVQ